MNRDIDLLKIEILADYWQAKISFANSVLIAGFVGLLVLLLTIYYEGKIDAISLTIGSLALYAILGIFGIRFIEKRHVEYMRRIEKLLRKIEEGEPLPSLVELKKMKEIKETKEAKKNEETKEREENEKEEKNNEKISLKDFIKENYPLIATIGVFGALTTLFVRLEELPHLAFITLMIFVVLTWELLDLFPEIEVPFRSSMKLMVFEFLMIILLMVVGWYILDTYVRIYYRVFTLTSLLGIYSVITIKVLEKLRLFGRVHTKVKGELYKLIRFFMLLTIFGIIIVLAGYSANYLNDLIESFML